MKLLVFISLILMSNCTLGQNQAEYSASLNKSQLVGTWFLLDNMTATSNCHCDTRTFWEFNPNGTFQHQTQSSNGFKLKGKYFLKKDYLILEYPGFVNDSVKISLYKSAYLILTTKTGDVIFKKDKYIGSLKAFPALPIFKNRFFLEGNILEADVDNNHVVFDSVYAYGGDGSKIYINAFNRDKKMGIALMFGIYDFIPINHQRVSLIGTGQGRINGVSPSSDATFRIDKKEYNTSMTVFPTSGWTKFGKGSGSFQNINFTPHAIGFDEISADFEFSASTTVDKSDNKYEEVKITNGKFKIIRIINRFELSDLLN